MSEFLSTEWFDELNATLREAGPVTLATAQTVLRVVIEFPDAPSSGPHAMTLFLGSDGATITAGDNLAADAIVRLTFADALALSRGQFDSASALRKGRVKVRGDVNAIVPALTWLQQAHAQASS